MTQSKPLIIYFIALHLLVIYGLYRYNTEPAQNVAAPAPYPYNSSIKPLLSQVDSVLSGNDIIFLGDSLTQNFTVRLVSKDAINFGIGGDIVQGLLERAMTYKSLSKAKAIVIQIGTNDCLAFLPVNEDSFKNLSEALPPSPPIYWYAVPPVGESLEKVNEKVRSLNVKIKAICESRKNCTFVDLSNQYADEKGNLRNDFQVGDGIHLNDKGYQVWLNDLRSKL